MAELMSECGTMLVVRALGPQTGARMRWARPSAHEGESNTLLLTIYSRCPNPCRAVQSARIGVKLGIVKGPAVSWASCGDTLRCSENPSDASQPVLRGVRASAHPADWQSFPVAADAAEPMVIQGVAGRGLARVQYRRAGTFFADVARRPQGQRLVLSD